MWALHEVMANVVIEEFEAEDYFNFNDVVERLGDVNEIDTLK